MTDGLPQLPLEAEPPPPAGHRSTWQRRRCGCWHPTGKQPVLAAASRPPVPHSAAAALDQPACQQRARLIFRSSGCSSASSKGGYPPSRSNRHTPSDHISQAGLSGELVWPCNLPRQDSSCQPCPCTKSSCSLNVDAAGVAGSITVRHNSFSFPKGPAKAVSLRLGRQAAWHGGRRCGCNSAASCQNTKAQPWPPTCRAASTTSGGM